MQQHIKLDFFARSVEFDMQLDRMFPQDAAVTACLQRYGCCEPEVCHLMVRALQAGDHAIDVGASVGFFTLLMAKLVGDSGAVSAFEPTPAAWIKLQENAVVVNKQHNVITRGVALGAKRDRKLFYSHVDSGSNSFAPGEDNVCSTMLDVKPLNDFHQPTKLIKIDAEGAEEQILRGATDFFPDTEYIVCEYNMAALTRQGSNGAALRNTALEHGYQTFLLQADGGLPVLVPRNTILLARRVNTNILFSTSEAVAKAWPSIDVL
jgi:FkbM family methyltransferase